MMDETTMTIITMIKMITIIAPDGAETVPFIADDLERAARGAGGRVPMKSDPEFEAAAETAYSVTAAKLRQFDERLKRLDAKTKDIEDQQKELEMYREALEMYREALGM